MAILEVGPLQPALKALLSGRDDVVRSLDGHDPAAIRVIVRDTAGVVDAALMASLPNLEVIVSNGAGVDTVDLGEARRRGIRVSNTPDVLADTTADTAVGLILMTLRRFAAADRYVRAGRWEQAPFPLARDLSGLQVGILGLGRIGSAIATRLLGFDCAIAYHNRRPVEGSAFRYADSARALAESVDVLVVATTGGPDTQQLVSREVLEALGPDGYLINIARGSVVDQEALIELLASGGLAGAGLDVYTDEPHVPSALRELDNVVLLPHIGSATGRTRGAMAELTWQNLNSYLRTGKLLTPVV